MTVRRRLLVIMCIAGLLGAIFVAVGADALLRTAVRERAVERIQAETSLVAHWVEDLGPDEDPQILAERVARYLGARVSLIAPDGTVIADSSRDRTDVTAMDNHLARPEVRDARLRGSGSSLRTSGTTNVQYFYASHRVSGDGPIGYVRLALPSSTVQSVQARYSWLIVGVVLVAIVLLVVFGYLAVRRLSRPMEKIALAVERSAQGDFHAALPVPREGGEEVSRLATSVRRLQLTLLQKIDELDDERSLLSSVIGGMREGLLLVDQDRRVRLANEALSRVLDLDFEPRGHLIEEVVRHPSVVNDIDAAMRDGREIVESVVSLPGSDRVFELHVARLDPRRTSGGTEVLALFVDITRLDRLEKVRREFVANVSHELRTPLTSIKAFVENLMDGGLDDAGNAQKFLQIVNRHADHMGELIEDLTDLSLIETGSVMLELRRVDATEVAREVVEQLKPLAAKRDVDVRIALTSPLPVTSDRRRLEQMLTNLVSNAIKFNREGGRVVLDGTASADSTTIVVEDTGIGIPAASQEKVFERFYQVSRDRSRAVGGTGLGLSIVKHLMRLHGGRVHLRSELGRGSKITLEFPTTDDERRVVPLATSAR
jgi:two-component system phosphate regulon sensor histidine kinase PhoR